jgi:hypothetical protein
MKIFYAANIDHTNTGSYALDEQGDTLDVREIGYLFTRINYGWKKGTVTQKGSNERYSYYEIEVENIEDDEEE